jgi:gas vesicle protein
MTSNQKLLAGVIIGAAAGVLATLFLHSEKGKGLLADAKDFADDTADSIKSKVDSLDSEVKELVKKGKKFVQDIGGQVNEAI